MCIYVLCVLTCVCICVLLTGKTTTGNILSHLSNSVTASKLCLLSVCLESGKTFYNRTLDKVVVVFPKNVPFLFCHTQKKTCGIIRIISTEKIF